MNCFIKLKKFSQNKTIGNLYLNFTITVLGSKLIYIEFSIIIRSCNISNLQLKYSYSGYNLLRKTVSLAYRMFFVSAIV